MNDSHTIKSPSPTNKSEIWTLITEKLTQEQKIALENVVDFRKYPEQKCEGFQLPSGSSMWILLEGHANIVMQNFEGKQIRLLRMNAGDFIPMTLKCQDPFHIEIAVEKQSETCFIPDTIRSRLMSDSEEIRNIELIANAAIVAKLVELIAELAFLPLTDRLMHVIEELCSEQQSRAIRVTHEEIANELGTAREVTSRLLKQMAEQGRLKLSRKRIVVIEGKNKRMRQE